MRTVSGVRSALQTSIKNAEACTYQLNPWKRISDVLSDVKRDGCKVAHYPTRDDNQSNNNETISPNFQPENDVVPTEIARLDLATKRKAGWFGQRGARGRRIHTTLCTP